jgi:amino acid transporter
MVDYVLTVAVSISAGTLAIISAIPEVAPYRLPLAVGAVLLMSFLNLRGVRESGAVLSIPAYAFIGIFAAMLIGGVVRLALGHEPVHVEGHAEVEVGLLGGVSLLLVLRAFSSGATARSSRNWACTPSAARRRRSTSFRR